MTFIIENPQTLLLELLEIVEKLLDIEFSPSEYKILFEYMKNNPNADPKQILWEIIALAEKKLNKKITEEKKRELDSRCRNAKILERIAKRKAALSTKKVPQAPKKGPPKKLTDQEIKRIVDAAEKKLLDKKILKRPLDDKTKKNVENDLKNNTKEEDPSVDIANRAILGVIKVGVAGGVRIVVLQNLGNPIVPDMNPFHGEAIIDRANNIDFSLQDPMGAKCYAVLNVIKTGNIDPMFVAKLDGQVSQAEQLNLGGGKARSISNVPTLTPYGKDSLEV